MDTVILAAGKGERLNGVAAPFHKPLMVVNGVPLIVQTVRRAATADGRIIIVAAPQNVEAICSLLEANDLLGRIHITIQPRPTGPADALLRGMMLVSSERTLVLMGDNILRTPDIKAVMGAQGGVVIGTQTVQDADTASRFTRVRPTGRTSEGPITREDAWPDGTYTVWCGPLVLDTKMAFTHLVLSEDSGIGPWLGDMTDSLATVPVVTIDIGVPEVHK